MAVCVGTGFVVNADGSLGLSGLRSGAWPYGPSGTCSLASINGLRLDATTGNLWVEPVDLRLPATADLSQSGSLTLSTTPTALAAAVFNVTNPDPCRSALIVGECAFSCVVSNIATTTIPVVRAGIYTGNPPVPPAIASVPVRWSEQNNGSATNAYTITITLPFAVTVAAGATMGVQMQIGASNSQNLGTLASGTWAYRATVMTQRAVY